ncbi:hypothetical protein Tco_0239947 [Tanacetum coccineum]
MKCSGEADLSRDTSGSESLALLASILIKEACSCVQDLTSGEIVSLNLLSRTRKFGHSTIKPWSSWQRRLIAADQASVFMAMTFEQRSSSLILHQMTSDHNRSELGITIPPSYSNAEDNR